MTLLEQARAALIEGQPQLALSFLEDLPPDADVLFLRAYSEEQLGHTQEAELLLKQCLQHSPQHADALFLLATLLRKTGRIIRARKILEQNQATRKNPDLGTLLASLWEQTGQKEKALQHLNIILETHPAHRNGRHNRALLLANVGNLTASLQDYETLLQSHPDESLYHLNAGDLLLALHEPGAARHHYLSVPENLRTPVWLKNCSVALAGSGNLSHAQTLIEQLRVEAPEEHHHLCRMFSGQLQNADHIEARQIYLTHQAEQQELCNWTERQQYQQAMLFHLEHGEPNSLYYLLYRALMLPLPAGVLRSATERMASQFSDKHSWHPATTTNPKSRIAYLSGDFGNHATGLLVRQLFDYHSDEFEVILITTQPSDGSRTFRQILGNRKHIDISSLSDEQAIATLRALDLDILVDLAGYSTHARPHVCAARVARKQIWWLAYPGTSGADWMDYMIADRHTVADENLFTEKILYLPESYFVFSHDAPPPTISRERLGLPKDALVFCCLNRHEKISPEIFEVWCTLLKEIPDSILWLLDGPPSLRHNLLSIAASHGIQPSRLVFAPRASPEMHLARLGAADLFLDTYPCNGHTVVAEALWAGLPVITLQGEAFASRVAASLLNNTGLDDLVATNPEAYYSKALHLARRPDLLAERRHQLQSEGRKAAFFNIRQQARNLEALYTQILG